MQRRGILTAGTWCVDRNKLVQFWPREDELTEILAEEVFGGGSACNLAIGMRKLDPSIPLSTMGLVGDDIDGHFLLDLADSNSIDRRRIALTKAAKTHYTDAFASQRTGRRTHVSNHGASHLLTPDHFDFAGATERFLHLGIIGVHRIMDQAWQDEPNGWVSVLKRAKQSGLRTNLELASTYAERLAEVTRPCLPLLDLLIVNDVEIGAISGVQTSLNGQTDIDACFEAVSQALSLSSAEIVVAHFPTGAIAACRDGTVLKCPSTTIPAYEIAGANGAGDAFAAGFLYAIHEEWQIEDALRLAHATAATSLRRMSTTEAVETWQSCLSLASKWGWREGLS